MKMNSKASLELLYFVIAVFVIGILSILSYTMMSEINTELNQSEILDSEGQAIMEKATSEYVSITDTFFSIVFFGLIIFVVVSAFYIRSHPVFFMVGVLALIVFSYFALILTGVYQEVVATETITAYEEEYTVIPFVIDNLLFFVAGIGAIILIIIFGKRSDV